MEELSKIKIKLTDPKYMPTRKYDDDSGYDLKAEILSKTITLNPGESIQFSTGVSIQLPAGYEGQIRSRSGLSAKGIIVPTGTIDSGYRGKLGVILYNFSKKPFLICDGDRIAQLVISPVATPKLVAVQELEISQRQDGGFGSTGVR